MNHKEYYTNTLRQLEDFLDLAIDVTDATAGQSNVPWNLVRGHQLYNRLTVTCMSFIHLLPENRYFPSNFKFWDFFSAATLARNFIENYYFFFYVCVDEVEPSETEFRLLLLTYHLNNEKFKFYKEANKTEILAEFEQNLPNDKRKISEHPFFQKLDRKMQGDILKGIKFKYLSNKEISQRIPFDTSEFEPLYRFFSNQAHSTPWAFFTQDNQRGRGQENEAEVSYITMAIEFVSKYLIAAILDMIKLFPESTNKLDARKIEFIKKEFEQKKKGS